MKRTIILAVCITCFVFTGSAQADWRTDLDHLMTSVSVEDQEMKQFNIRLGDRDIELLRSHFKRKGLKLSAGIRMVLKHYLAEQGLG